MKCEHERSIHLFIDSLLNEGDAARAYRCGSNDAFDRGMCLGCRGGRCNTVGYGTSRVRTPRRGQMYTRTRASMPFRGQSGSEVIDAFKSIVWVCGSDAEAQIDTAGDTTKLTLNLLQ